MNFKNGSIKKIVSFLVLTMILLSNITSLAVVLEEDIFDEESNDKIEVDSDIYDNKEKFENTEEEIIEEIYEDFEEEQEELKDEFEKEENESEKDGEIKPQVRAFSLDQFSTSNVNYIEFPLGFNNIQLDSITNHIKAGQTLRVVIYNPKAKVSLGDIRIDGKIELVSYSDNADVQKLANENRNIVFKKFLEIEKSINGETQQVEARVGDEIEVNIDIRLNEYIEGSVFCCYPCHPPTGPGGNQELPEDNEENEHDGYRDINISLDEVNDLDLINIRDVEVLGGLSDEHIDIKSDGSNILSVNIPRDFEPTGIIRIKYKGELSEEGEYTTYSKALVENEDIKVTIPEGSVRERHLTEYTVRYVDNNGRDLTEPEIFIGEIGTEARVGVKSEFGYNRYGGCGNRYAYSIIGNNHQNGCYRYKASLWLDEDASKNEIVFRYKRNSRIGSIPVTRDEIIGKNETYNVYHVDNKTNENIIKPITFTRKVGVHHNSLINETLSEDILRDINYKYVRKGMIRVANSNYGKMSSMRTRESNAGSYTNGGKMVYDVFYYYDSIAPKVPVDPGQVEGVLEDHITQYKVEYVDENGNEIMEPDYLNADKGGSVTYNVRGNLSKFNWNPMKQYWANSGNNNISPTSPTDKQVIKSVDNDTIRFQFAPSKGGCCGWGWGWNSRPSYIDKNQAEYLYRSNTVRHRDVSTRRDIVEPVEYKKLGGSYVTNRPLSRENQAISGYKLVNLSMVNGYGRESSLKKCGRIPLEYANSGNYDLIYDYEYVGGTGPETEGPGWINPVVTEEVVESNTVDVTVVSKNPQEMTVNLIDVKTEELFLESTFDNIDGEYLNPGDIITIGEEFELDGTSIKELLDKEGHSIITALPFEFEIVESESLEDGEIGNEIDIYYMPGSEDGYVNYTIRHVYEDDKGNLVDIVNRRVGQDDLGDRVVAEPEVFENFEYIEEEDSKYIDLVEDPNKNVIIFKYERVKDGEEIDNYEGNSSYTLNHRYVDSEDLIREEVYEDAVTGVKILKKLEHIGAEQYVLERQPFEIEVVKGKEIIRDVYYSNMIEHPRRTNYLIQYQIKTKDGLMKDIKNPEVINTRVAESVYIDWESSDLLVVEDDGIYYKLDEAYYGIFLIMMKEEINIFDLEYNEISKEEAEDLLNGELDYKNEGEDPVETPEEIEEESEIIDEEDVIEEIEEIEKEEPAEVGIDLSGMNLGGVAFKSMNLRYANFSGSRLTNADLTDMDLTGINFRDAVLIGVDFRGSNALDEALKGAFEGAFMEDCKF